MTIRTGKTHPSYVHLKIIPTPELEDGVKLNKVMQECMDLVRDRVGSSAEVVGHCTLNPRCRV